MWTDDEIREWLGWLPMVNKSGGFRRCVDNKERQKVLEDMLRHANFDHMTAEDVGICKRALCLLRMANAS